MRCAGISFLKPLMHVWVLNPKAQGTPWLLSWSWFSESCEVGCAMSEVLVSCSALDPRR